jgi:hypothetical protein
MSTTMPLSERLFNRASALANGEPCPTDRHLDEAMPPDTEVLLCDDRVLKLPACLLSCVSPYFAAALRHKQERGLALQIDCREDEPFCVHTILKVAFIGGNWNDWALEPADFIALVRTSKKYLVQVPECAFLTMTNDFRINSRGGFKSHGGSTVVQHKTEAEIIEVINGALGEPIVRSTDWDWCNYCAPNSEADYRDFVVIINGQRYNTGRHYTSCGASVSLTKALSWAIVKFLDE